MQTGNNDLFLRMWYEVVYSKINFSIRSIEQSVEMGEKWIPQPKGGPYRKWYGNLEYVVNFGNGGMDLNNYDGTSIIKNPQYYFLQGITWSHTTSKAFSARYMPEGYIFNVEAPSLYLNSEQHLPYILGVFNTKVLDMLFGAISQTMHYMAGDMAKIPLFFTSEKARIESVGKAVKTNIENAKCDWDSFEISWDFRRHPLI